MAKFFVGQRVRISHCTNPVQKHHVGKEGRIVAACDVFPNHWEVDSALRNSSGGPCSWDAPHLTPILPEGHKAGDYSFHELMDRCREGLPA